MRVYTKIFFIISAMMSCSAYGAAGYRITDDGRLVYFPGEKMVDVFIRLRLFEEGVRAVIVGKLPVSQAQKGVRYLESYVREEVCARGICDLDGYVVKVVAPQSRDAITDAQYGDMLLCPSPFFNVYIGLPENIP